MPDVERAYTAKPKNKTIHTLAPGKVVLWGEYAVLAGAPAAIMAVNRYARVRLTPATSLQITAEGFLGPGIHAPTTNFTQLAVAQMAETTLQQLAFDQYPYPVHLHTDSRDLYQAAASNQAATAQMKPQKLGLGSSAAVCVATYLALCTLLDHRPQLAEALVIHRNFQNGSGSGLDIATSWHGGTISFQTSAKLQNNAAKPLTLPKDLHWSLYFTGLSSATPTMLRSFAQWRAQGQTHVLEDLCRYSADLTNHCTLAQLITYTQCLVELDQQAQLNIFTHEHRQLATIAVDMGLVYKPCGAGGGDIGMVFSDDPERLANFDNQALQTGAVKLDVEIAQHGVRVTT